MEEAQPFFPRLEYVLLPCEFGKRGAPPVRRGWRPQDLGAVPNSAVNLLCEVWENVPVQRLSKEKKASEVTLTAIRIWALKSILKALKISPVFLWSLPSPPLRPGPAGEDGLSLAAAAGQRRVGALATTSPWKKKVLSGALRDSYWVCFVPGIKAGLKWSALSRGGISTCLFSALKLSILYSDATETDLQPRRCSLVPVVFCSALKLHDFNVNFWSISFPNIIIFFPGTSKSYLRLLALKATAMSRAKGNEGSWCFFAVGTQIVQIKKGSNPLAIGIIRNFYVKTKSMGIFFAAFSLLNILRVPVCTKLWQPEELINLLLFMISSQTFITLASENKVRTSLFFCNRQGTRINIASVSFPRRL